MVNYIISPTLVLSNFQFLDCRLSHLHLLILTPHASSVVFLIYILDDFHTA
jgi:hypothetical protein